MSNTNIQSQVKNQIISKSIRSRLIRGFVAITLVLAAAIFIVILRTATVQALATRIITVDFPSHDAAYDLVANIYLSQSSLSNWLLSHDPTFKSDNTNAWTNIGRLTNKLNELSTQWTSKENQDKWINAKEKISQLKTLENTVINSPADVTQNKGSEVTQSISTVLDIIDGPVNTTGERKGGLFDAITEELQTHNESIITEMQTIRMIEYGLLVGCILIAIFITIYTINGIMGYIKIFRKHSEKVAAGDLTKRIFVETNDEMGQLGNDLNNMTESLATITKQITEACHHMVTSIEEVRHSVDVQSTGATEQASSINEITASLDEIEKSSNQTIEKAKMLGDVSDRTRAKGQMGLQAVEQSIEGMKSVRDKVQMIAQTILDLSNQTQQVGEITAVVNTLAQQSKMLALNASIEAAKAGDAGKGFSVVAAEVKNLAEQSEQSTAQVQKILENIRHATEKAVMVTEEGTKGVDQGMILVEQTGDVVRSLSDVIDETTVASQQIEAAIRQEGIGIEQITAGMNEINQVTASSVDSVKQTTEAIANLATLVKNLKEHIDVYKI